MTDFIADVIHVLRQHQTMFFCWPQNRLQFFLEESVQVLLGVI